MNLNVLQDGSERISYHDPSIPIYVCRSDLRHFPNMSALCHWHEDVELLMPINGHLDYKVNGHQVTVGQGDAILVNSRQMHHGFSSDRTDCDYICIVFRPELLCANTQIRDRFVLPLLTDSSFTHIILKKDEPAHLPMLDIIRRVFELYEASPPGYELSALGMLFEFWSKLFFAVGTHRSGSTDVNVAILKSMLEYIRTHYDERISLDRIASAGGVCRSKCCTVFKKYLGTSPNEYLNSFRLEKSMELLEGTSLPITEIAYLCGFCSASYFTEMFSARKGCSPKQYRKCR